MARPVAGSIGKSAAGVPGSAVASAGAADSGAVGAVVSSVMLSRTVGNLEGGRLVRFLVRLVIAVALSCLVAYGVRVGMAELVGSGATWGAVVRLGAVGLVFLVAYVALARVLRITEISDVMSLVTRRLRRSR